ncbi:MAG: phytanoyl-CoA dioxygenase [Myxococcaceae bacterium]|nr:MAG: phytanoyl-CoA dioxygenase [Myxococcaceae bacterium]
MRHLEAILAVVPASAAGVRLRHLSGLASMLAASGPVGRLVTSSLGAARPVRAILFNKSPDNNWALGWHQDRIIAVQKRYDVPGFSHWTTKAGMLHVAPPIELLARMITVRVHLDPVGPDNAPLLVAPGSHRLGLVAEGDLATIVARCGTVACLADRGDAWLYSTPILHASQAATRPTQRRVLQVDYSADELPGGLEWLGV